MIQKILNSFSPARTQTPAAPAISSTPVKNGLSTFTLVSAANTLLPSAQAMAQTPGAMEVSQAAFIVPGLPPSLQLIAGGLLFAQPMLRWSIGTLKSIWSFFKPLKNQESLSEALVAAEVSHSFAEKLNQISGTIESRIAPLRDPVVGLTAVYSLISNLDKPLAVNAIELGALTLVTGSVLDRGRLQGKTLVHQLNNEQVLTPEGGEYYHHSNLGILSPDLPDKFPEKYTLQANGPDYAGLAKTPSTTSVAHNLAGLKQISSSIQYGFRRHIGIEGFFSSLKGYVKTLSKKHAPLSERFLKAIDVILPQWAMKYARANNMTVNFENLEALSVIPKNGLTIFAAAPHSSIYPDFTFWMKFPRARFLADLYNFHHHKVIAWIGLAWFLDVIGLPFTERRKTQGQSASPNGKLTAESLLDKMKMGIQPVFFPQAGRSPRAYHEDGTPDIPGLYANVVDVKKPELYMKDGIMRNAVEIAALSERTVHVPVLHIDGAYKVMPKISEYPPFVQENTSGQTVTFRVNEVLYVNPKDTLEEAFPKLVTALKATTNINHELRERVKVWKEALGRPDKELKTFFNLSDSQKDEKYFILVDRIRSIPPRYQERNNFQNRFFNLLGALAGKTVSEQTVMDLLREVSSFVKKIEYAN